MAVCWVCFGAGGGPAEGNSMLGNDSEGLLSNGPMETCPACGGTGEVEGWFD